MFGNDEKKEFGDYQTPTEFCQKVCEYIKKYKLADSAKAILDPTCGVGNFLHVASDIFGRDNVYGIEINEEYVRMSKETTPWATIISDNIFNINTREICGEDDVLIIGNPPWASNSNLSYNLPVKINFKGLRGIDALTGSSNFDICEYIILKLLDEYKNTNSTICMLCKTSVARNVILEMSRKKTNYQKVEILNFNGNMVFGISATSCVLMIKLSSEIPDATSIICEVKNFDDESLIDTLVVTDGKIKKSKTTVDLEGKCQFTWRQGVKHDCGKVMELDFKNGKLQNKNKEVVDIEDGLVFPLVKSSHFKKPILNNFSKFVIVTQTKPKQDTAYIQRDYPLTWDYLNANIDCFNNRKSIIYKKSAPFSMFGIGNYSFAPYKVGLSGFYKKPLFCLMHSDKPVMTDDTAYLLAFDNYDIAYCVMVLLNSKIVQEFLLSIAFLDNKRPYTVKLLSRIDIQKCVDAVSFDDLLQTEIDLGLPQYVTTELYAQLVSFVRNKPGERLHYNS